MADGLRHGAGLAVARHPSVDEPRVASQASVRADAQSLSDSRAKALEQHIGSLDQIEDHGGTVRVLQVEGDRAPPAVQQLDPVVLVRTDQPAACAPVDPDDVGSQVGEQHRGEWPRADSAQLDDAQAAKWAGVCRPGESLPRRHDAHSAMTSCTSRVASSDTGPWSTNSPCWSAR